MSNNWRSHSGTTRQYLAKVASRSKASVYLWQVHNRPNIGDYVLDLASPKP